MTAIPLLRADFTAKPTLDAFERLLWWLFVGSAGARTRALVLRAIREQPRNAQQLSQHLHLDYTTIRHHLGVLERNRIIIAEGDKYGKVYFLSDSMESHWNQLEAILKKMRGMKGGEQSK
jgi:DNA-binding transcriptional ArsR family regulator